MLKVNPFSKLRIVFDHECSDRRGTGQSNGIKTTSQNLKISKHVYEIIKKVPKGKVMTYGQITDTIWKSKIPISKFQKKVSPRYVGYILHNNPDPEGIPCHRVVNTKGKLAKNYKFGGWFGQKKLLTGENVVFKNYKTVDLDLCLWN